MTLAIVLLDPATLIFLVGVAFLIVFLPLRWAFGPRRFSRPARAATLAVGAFLLAVAGYLSLLYAPIGGPDPNELRYCGPRPSDGGPGPTCRHSTPQD